MTDKPDVTSPRDSYKLSELAEHLNAPVEKVKTWLRDADIQPVSPDRPDDYAIDSIEKLRLYQVD
ncbi:MAG: hypothetical protein U5L04_02825 [Trueperaceae bacterium]|nr:hypothetical protein [Trueperaceae bacterium]